MIGPKSVATLLAFLFLVPCGIGMAAAETCTFSVSPAHVTAGVHGLPDPTDPRAGAGRPPGINVTASKAECGWTASTSVSWIQILTANGSGSGYAQYRVAENKTGAPRAGTIQVAGKTVTIRQDSSTDCTVTVSPANVSVPEQGAPEASSDPRAGASPPLPRLTVTTSKEICTWMASTNVPWVQLMDTKGKGSGYVRYTVMRNTSGSPRTGTIKVDRQTLTIRQDYSGTCTFSVTPASISVSWQGTDPDPRAGASPSSRLTVSASRAHCQWSAKSNSSWIKVPAMSGTGSGSVPYGVVQNTSGSPRTGTIGVAGKTVTVKQEAQTTKSSSAATGTTRNNCRASLSPSGTTVESKRSSGAFKVKTGNDCPWTATTRTAWIGITSGASLRGDGTVQYAVEENKGAKRTGTIAIAGKTFRITQKEDPAFKRGKALKGDRKKPDTRDRGKDR